VPRRELSLPGSLPPRSLCLVAIHEPRIGEVLPYGELSDTGLLSQWMYGP
jgi:hypothetical protein